MSDTKLPVWANNDLATYSAFTGLPTDLVSQAPKSLSTKVINAPVVDADGVPTGETIKQTVIDTSKLPKGVKTNYDDNGNISYTLDLSTPQWSAGNLTANYDPTTGKLQNFVSPNPVFPADPNGNLTKVKFTPSWDASGKATSVQDTSHGGWAGTPILMAAASMIPGVAPVMAGLNAVNSLAHGKLNTGTILNGLTAATGLGGQLGFDPSTIDNLKTAQQVASGVNAYQKGNTAGMVNALLQVSGTANQDTNTAIQMVNAATALKKNDMAGAMSALSGLTGSPDLKIASTAANILQSINPSATPQGATATQPTAQAQAAQAPQNVLVAAPVVGNMVALDQFGVKNPFLSSGEKQVVTDTGYAHGGSVEDLLRILRS
jgi:hypothetical protein